MNFDFLTSRGFRQTEDYYYDETHHSSVFFSVDQTCVIIDHDLCNTDNGSAFDYSKYCEMQNTWMNDSKALYRFYAKGDEDISEEIISWFDKDPDSIEVKDKGGSFDKAHVDNTPLEKEFEDIFMEAYGNDSVNYLQKEYSLSLNEGRNAFVDYVIETDHGSFAIEENGVHYHHPQLIPYINYQRQLEKQNTLSLYGFKTFRFSTGNLQFKDQTIDSLKHFLGEKNTFRHANLIGGTRAFSLYEHQENVLHELKKAREQGIFTSLVVCPTGSGKSQIAIEDIKGLYEENRIRRVLIMVPTKAIREDWEKRLKLFPKTLQITVQLYNKTFLSRNELPQDYYDYILFDAYGIIGLNSKDSTDKGFLKLSPILFSPQKRLMVDLRRKHAQNEDLSAKRSAACNFGSTVSDVVPSHLLQRQSAEHTPDVDLHRSTVRYPKDVSLACAA